MKAAPSELVIYTDGGSRGNPGPAAIGVVFAEGAGTVLKRYGKTIGIKTNNEAEYEAVLFALQKAKALFGSERIAQMRIQLRMDSELVCRQLKNEYRVDEERLWPLFMKIRNILLDIPHISFTHVPRERNREADKMVNEALDRNQGSLLGE
ncbi:reverse transcriptase-like protein [Candidatus Parcubacteria bacterium]|nr:MAG: reverse transcriptase-like protein [Candidatus Parcubacteria bacterium]